MRLAHQNGKLDAIPYILIPKVQNVRTNCISYKDFLILLNGREKEGKHIPGLPESIHPFVIALWETMRRKEEIRRLVWDRPFVDGSSGVARLREKSIQIYHGETKTGEGAELPMSEWLYETLAVLKAERDMIDPTFPWVFYRNVHGKLRPLLSIQSTWHTTCARLGFGTLIKREGKRPLYSGLNLHDIRRSAITEARKAGNSESQVMLQSGHKARATFQRYNIVDFDDLKDIIRRRERAREIGGNE